MTEHFYDIAKRLDELKGLTTVAGAQARELARYIEEQKYARYFFRDLENPAWLEPLFGLGKIAVVPKPVESKENPGYFTFPIWHEGEYLKRMADRFPEMVRDVALSLETENARAIRTMLEMLVKVPVEITAQTVSQFEKWVGGPFAGGMMLAQELGITMQYLAEHKQTAAAIQVLSVLLDPAPMKDRADPRRLEAGSRLDFYWLEEALKNNLPLLMERDSIGVAILSEAKLKKALSLEFDPKIESGIDIARSHWRWEISPQSSLAPSNDLKYLLVDTNIAALNEACKQRDIRAAEILSQYIDDAYSILRRIAVYVLRSWGKEYPTLLEDAYAAYRADPDSIGEGEISKLIEGQFASLPESIRRQWLTNILNGPDEEWIASAVSAQYEAEAFVERWKLRRLDPIQQFLHEQERALYEDLLGKYGKPSPVPEGAVVTSWGGPESPVDPASLKEKSIQEVIQYLIDYAPPPGESFGNPSRAGLARAFQQDVEGRAAEYANRADLLVDPKLRFVYHTAYLRGLENSAKAGQGFAAAKVVELCQFIGANDADNYEKAEMEDGLPAAKIAIVQLLERLFRAEHAGIEAELLQKAGQLIIDLLHQDEPFPYNEESSGFDPATHSLNCLHGVAMHSLVMYALYCERRRKANEGQETPPVMLAIVKVALDEFLDSAWTNRSLAVHAVLGWYFPQFIYLDKDWALTNRQRIFPTDEEHAAYRRAAWSAYVRFADVFTNVFPHLIEEYRIALAELPQLNAKPGDRIDERLAQHILKAYLLDMVKLEPDDGLLASYYRNAGDETRSQGNFWLSQALAAQKPSAEDLVWKKIWALWQWRIEQAVEAQEPVSNAKEATSFGRLLKSTPLELDVLFPILRGMLKFRPDGFELNEILKYTARTGKGHPERAVSLLNDILMANPDLYLLQDGREAVKQILSFAVDADEQVRSLAREIVNMFGERGDYDWREFLGKLGQ